MAWRAISKHISNSFFIQRVSQLHTASTQIGNTHQSLLPEALISLPRTRRNCPVNVQNVADESIFNLQQLFSGLTVSSGGSHLPGLVHEYKLPTTWYNGVHKRSIIDQTFSIIRFELPTVASHEIEKLDPFQGILFPMVDPSPLQRIIDQGAPPITKETLPRLITIRHKKMKKHQRRKLRKRMRFLRRKLEAVKRKKKEKIIQDYEKSMAKWSQEFDADRFVEDHLGRARKAGWEIDIIAERAGKQAVTENPRD